MRINKYKAMALFLFVSSVSLFCSGCEYIEKAKNAFTDPLGFVISIFTQLVATFTDILNVGIWWEYPLIAGVFWIVLLSFMRKYAHLVAYFYLRFCWLFILFPWALSLIFGFLKPVIDSYKRVMGTEIPKLKWTVREATFGTLGCAIIAGRLAAMANNPKGSVYWKVTFVIVGVIGFVSLVGFVLEKTIGKEKRSLMGKAGKNKFLDLWLRFRYGHSLKDSEGVTWRRCAKCKKWYNSTDSVCEKCGYPNTDAPWDCVFVFGKDSKGRDKVCGEKNIPAKKKRCKNGHRKPPVLVTKCTNCGDWNSADKENCESCGEPLTGGPATPPPDTTTPTGGGKPKPVTCICGTVSPADYNFCSNPNCQKPLRAVAEDSAEPDTSTSSSDPDIIKFDL